MEPALTHRDGHRHRHGDGTGIGIGAGARAGPGTGTGTKTGTGSGTGNGTGAGTESRSSTRTRTWPGAGTTSSTETGTGTGTATKSDTGIGTGSGMGTGTGEVTGASAQHTLLPQPPAQRLFHSHPLEAAGLRATSLPRSPRKGLEGQLTLLPDTPSAELQRSPSTFLARSAPESWPGRSGTFLPLRRAVSQQHRSYFVCALIPSLSPRLLSVPTFLLHAHLSSPVCSGSRRMSPG